MPVPHHLVFTGQMPFLPPNQERQSTEGFSSVSRVNTVRVSNRIKVRFIFSSDGSVSAFEVGIGFFPYFSVFLMSFRYLVLVFQNTAISVFHIFPFMHYFKSVRSLCEYVSMPWYRPPTLELAQCRPTL